MDRGTPEVHGLYIRKKQGPGFSSHVFRKEPKNQPKPADVFIWYQNRRRVPTVLIDSVHPDPQLSRRDRSSMPLLPKAAVLLLQTAAVFAGPAYAPFTSFGNFTRRTDLCADAARVARGEVPAETQNNALNS